MELKLLEDFLCLNDTRNFSRAAEARNVTQSALSKRIRALEYWVGATLVDRSSHPIELTPEGAAMVAQARELVATFQGMRAGIRAHATPGRNCIRLAALHTLRVAVLPPWRRRIEAATGPLAMESNGSFAAYAQTLRQFRNGESDLLLTYVHPAVSDGLCDDAYESCLLGHDRLLPVSAPDADGQPMHRLDGAGIINFLSYGTSSFFARALAPLLNERPMALNVAATNAMSVGLQSLAKVGCGLAWIPETLAAPDLRSGALVQAGGPEWVLALDIRLFRQRRTRRPVIDRVWQAAQTLLAEDAAKVTPLRQAN
ncbi:LysR family transcriptional regulator [Falsirhodobacter algicola]|uniref:LysR family transcriptional regulator n=1 Tax=Falsirhodobacter algicola TaxID=2692330 RepID=A0A8J8MTF2_9RHOB|nr:LysR family transcriptional regulator [Falsirhodobacter algicola]QUS36142.1 LysR family transcriptional regulator [Falsirhodobacter algicola]